MCLPVRVSDAGLLSSPPESESEVMKQREQNGQRQAEGVESEKDLAQNVSFTRDNNVSSIIMPSLYSLELNGKIFKQDYPKAWKD